MFHVLLPLIAILPGMLFLLVIGMILLGVAFLTVGIVTLIVRAVRKSKKKGSLIAAIVLLICGFGLLAPIGIGVYMVSQSDLPSRTSSSQNDESDTNSLPLFEASGTGETRFMYDGGVLVPVRFELASDEKKFYEMERVARIDFKDDLLPEFILYKGTLSNGCDYFMVKGLRNSYVWASELEEVQASYDIEVLDDDY